MEAIEEVFIPLPNFSAGDLKLLKTYFRINLLYTERINEELTSQLVEHALWGPILASLDPEELKQQNELSLETQRAAIYENKWKEYATMLMEQGKIYAQMHVSYADWYDLVARYKFLIMPYIKRDYATDIVNAVDFLDGLSRFTDYVMYVIAEAYFSEKTGLKQLNAELEQKVADRTAELEAMNKELEAFSYSVSHDLRAPIRAINGYASILEEDYSARFNPEGLRILHSVKRNSKKMGELIDDLLSFSRLGRQQVQFSDIDMRELVSGIVEELLEEDGRNKVELTIGELPRAKGDPVLIRQVWINLVSNALKYSKYQPKIEISVEGHQREGEIEYMIRDNGVGFDMRYYESLFGVFQRLHSQEEFEGTGIGLAIVKKIVKRHNGSVRAESKQNEGAVFYFSLPCEH